MGQPLMICAACGRPQLGAGGPCVACGASLLAPAGKEELKSARDQILDAFQPVLEANLGRGRRVVLSEKRLEWHPGAGSPVLVELPRLKGVRLERRPVWEALLFLALFGAGAGLAPWPWLRLVLGGLAGVASVACLAQRRFALALEVDGARGRCVLGIGTPRSPVAQRIESIWASLRQELTRLEVPCGP